MLFFFLPRARQRPRPPPQNLPNLPSQDRLLQLLAGHFLDRADRLAAAPAGDDDPASTASVVAANVDAALSRVPALATGVDVNVRFAGPRAFEFTPELALFDLAGVGLVHGWVMGPDDPEAGALAAGGAGGPGASYNALAALAIEAGGGEGGGPGGAGAGTAGAPPPPPPPPPPPRSLMDEDWPAGGGGAVAAAAASFTAPAPSAPPVPGGSGDFGLDSVPSSDLADAVEARLSLGGGGAGSGAAVPPEVAAMVARAVAQAAGGGGGRVAAVPTPNPATPTPTPAVSRPALAAAAAAFPPPA